jgi:hypothetical protein
MGETQATSRCCLSTSIRRIVRHLRSHGFSVRTASRHPDRGHRVSRSGERCYHRLRIIWESRSSVSGAEPDSWRADCRRGCNPETYDWTPYRTPFWRPIRTTGSPGRYVIQAQILRRSFATLIAASQRLTPDDRTQDCIDSDADGLI